ADDLPNVAANRNPEPTRLTKSLQGELDWVVMKALEKDRTRRYDTANGLARDLERYLADEVVEARPPSTGYRVRKFVRRHKGQVLAASLVLIALQGGIVAASNCEAEATVQAKEAIDNAKRADDKAKDEAIQRKRAEENGALANHRLDNGNVRLATAAFDNRDAASARLQLYTIDPKRRGWEWHYLRHQF